ncbi:FecCD family ABC transporter permease [Desmospora profundinema]|uniref:Iron complex transport system permease protein n=1 Tax=Desmospora profundinema TaxID=1571184 RepID=A0ABU1IM00_9BACL|nr:iron ABC transporter permease [Desmospora profundinema]MDR6225811.1 iron complex transport system permease protein [Desmospora profundinema]
MKYPISIRSPIASFLLDRRAPWVWLALLLANGALFTVNLGSGELSIPPLDVWLALLGQGSSADQMILHSLRLPRVVTACLVGIAMGTAGALFQGVMRNPLASPDIIGVTGGASVAAVAVLTFTGSGGGGWLPLAAFGGGAAAAALIYILAWKEGVSPLRLVLIGIGIQTAAQGLTTLFLILSPIHTTSQAMVWLTGSIYASSWSTVYNLLPWLTVFLPLAWLLTRPLNLLQLGDPVAVGLGGAIQWHRFAITLTGVALAAAAVSVAGPIGFVGLMAPHIARLLTGPAYGSMLPAAALTGSMLVMAADWVARIAFSPLDLPAGLFTAVLGAPFLLVLLLRSDRHST